MKNGMKYMILVLAGALALSMSCQREDLPVLEMSQVPEGYKAVEFYAAVPDMDKVRTRAVDPDGAGVQQMTVFCFDANSFFITTVTASLAQDAGNPSLSGKFSVTVPDHTVTLQLVGNQNLTYFKEDNYRGMSEVDVMAALESSPGRMIYWARETLENLAAHASSSNPVRLLRNQAKITLNVGPDAGFVQKGWVVVNSNSFGTVAPYSPEYGGFVAPTVDTPFITLPENRAKLGDFLDVNTNDEDYIFETDNTEADPIDFIVKGSQNGGEDLYYRVSLIDENGDNVMIMRNHHYIVNIVGELYYGQKTFAEALEAPATNNVWVSVSDNIAEVQDSEYRLAVDRTSVVIGEDEFMTPNTYYLHYTLESVLKEDITLADVYWMDGNNVALNNFTHTFDSQTGRGTIIITLNQMGDLMHREGTLVIKKGRLSRKIKVVTVKEQKFEPAWITTNVYGVGTDENVTMMFTIPEDCPKELLPLEVLISVDALEIRNESGMALPIRRRGEEGYGEDNSIGYKYVLNVTQTGTQRIYLETILEQVTGNTIDVSIEADHFQKLTKTATFQSEVNQWILIHNLRTYSAVQPADEVIYYYLVPQKVNAPVELETHLGKDIVWNSDHTVAGWTAVEPGAADEFLFYSRFLDNDEGASDQDFTFYEVSSDKWSTGGRVHGFKRNIDGTEGSGAVYRMLTNTPRSAEVVRIASNPAGSASVTGSGTCEGSQYRSIVFELANYHPFHFAAQINGQGTVVRGNSEEVTDNIYLTYVPGQTVDIDIDITSFTSSILGASDDEQVSVDPFGTGFDIYIDAPMLVLDKTSDLYRSGKLEEDPMTEGRFIYHVDASRTAERMFGTLEAAVTDDMASADQSGERKRLSFLTKGIVTSGKITISSEESKVVYYRKEFNVHNSSFEGTIKYRPRGGSSVSVIPAGSFVPFEVEPTYNRIGTVTVSDGGHFELRLRSEYEYDWSTDNVKFQFKDEYGNIYEKVYGSLNAFYSSISNDIILEPVD